MDSLLSVLFFFVILFFDGLIFGIAIRKGLAAVMLVLIGLLLAGFVGLSIPFLSLDALMTNLKALFVSKTGDFSNTVYAFPVFWLVGLVSGLFI